MADDIYSLLEGSEPSTDQQIQAMSAALRGRNAQLRQKQRLGEALSIGTPAAAQLLSGNAQGEAQQGLGGLEKLRELGLQRVGQQVKLGELQNMLRHQGVEEQNAAERLGNEETQQRFQRGHQAAELGLQEERFGEEKTQRAAEKVKELGKELAPHAELYANLRHINGLLQKHPDAPGVGTVGGLIPKPFTTQEEQDLRQSIDQLGLQYDKATGGARAINPEMLSKLQGATGLNTRGTVTGIMLGLQSMKRNADADVAAKAGAYSPEVQESYFSRVKGIPRPGGEPRGAEPDHAAAEKWARANPTDPRAKAILQHLATQVGTARK